MCVHDGNRDRISQVTVRRAINDPEHTFPGTTIRKWSGQVSVTLFNDGQASIEAGAVAVGSPRFANVGKDRTDPCAARFVFPRWFRWCRPGWRPPVAGDGIAPFEERTVFASPMMRVCI